MDPTQRHFYDYIVSMNYEGVARMLTRDVSPVTDLNAHNGLFILAAIRQGEMEENEKQAKLAILVLLLNFGANFMIVRKKQNVYVPLFDMFFYSKIFNDTDISHFISHAIQNIHVGTPFKNNMLSVIDRYLELMPVAIRSAITRANIAYLNTLAIRTGDAEVISLFRKHRL